MVRWSDNGGQLLLLHLRTLTAAKTLYARNMPDLNAKDRDFLDENFKRFGPAWSGGLSALEKDFDVQVRI